MIITIYAIRQKLFLRSTNKMKSYRIKILVMILFILLGITIAHAQQKEKTFDLGKNGQIEVSIDYGDIKIETWGKDQVSVKYEEDEDADYSSFKMVQDGNILTITSGDYSSEDLVISVPSSINLDLNTDGGDILIGGNITGKVECVTAAGDIGIKDITGNADLNTAGGEITAGKIDGDVTVTSGGGDLQIGTITGEANFNTGGGNIRVNNVGKALKVNTGGGNVGAGNVGGIFRVSTGGGNIDVKKVTGGVKVTTGGGDVSVEGSNGKTSATSGGGNLSLKGISGAVDCYTGSGDVYVELNPDSKMNSEIKSGSGTITLYIPASAKATIIAKVRGWDSWGEDKASPITSEFINTTEDKSSHSVKSTYLINGGGSTIKLETTSGEIYIKKQK
jgi:hypothetical protein